MSIYRFRGLKYLLDEKYQELEKQEIYFSSPDSLNDPIEGFKDLFWSGDEIVWKNFLKHYLLCLGVVVRSYDHSGDEKLFDAEDIPVFLTTQHFVKPEAVELHEKICDKFFKTAGAQCYFEHLINRRKPIRRNELSSYLNHLHIYALGVIFSIYGDAGLIDDLGVNDYYISAISAPSDRLQGIEHINAIEEEYPDEDATEKLFARLNNQLLQLRIIHEFNNNYLGVTSNRWFVHLDFPDKYLLQLEKVVHNDWYVACFTDAYWNPSMWSHYGDGHEGVCLKFKTKLVDDRTTVKLRGVIGTAGGKGVSETHVIGDRDFECHKVEYTSRYPEIDFFRSLGQLPMPAITFWYGDGAGKLSVCADDIYNNQERWIRNYQETFTRTITTKLMPWEHEEEYRLTLRGAIIDYTKDKSSRLWKYQFDDLEGIIFGIKTPRRKILEIMKIIENKCRSEGRSDFKFYQAYYAKHDGKIGILEMPYLKFET